MDPVPRGIVRQPDGFCYRPVEQLRSEGQTGTMLRQVCEDCWQDLPHYVIAPRGFVSPESDRKTTPQVMMRSEQPPITVQRPLQKAVCLDCYGAAFQRVYPGAVWHRPDDAVREPLLIEASATNVVEIPMAVPDPFAKSELAGSCWEDEIVPIAELSAVLTRLEQTYSLPIPPVLTYLDRNQIRVAWCYWPRQEPALIDG